jgi:hypothetical protein
MSGNKKGTLLKFLLDRRKSKQLFTKKILSIAQK